MSFEDLAKKMSKVAANLKVSQEKVKQNNKFFKELIEELNVLILRINSEGKILLYNQECQNIIGYNRDEILGKNWFSMVYSDHQREKAEAAYKWYLERQIALPKYVEEKIITRNGEIKIIAWHNVPLYNNEKKLISLLRIGEDVSKKRRLELKLKQENTTLHKNNSELENIISVVSHDLKNPLYILQDFAAILVEDYKESFSEEVKYYLKRIKINAGYMEKLIIDLLELSRIGTIGSNKQPCLILHIIERVVSELEDCIKNNNIEIIYDKNFPIVYCDPDSMMRVFTNLISNAIKFKDKDSAELRIEIGFAEKGHFFEFYVKDNGIGIDKEFHEKIFMIFQRLSDKKGQEGTGIGLTIVKKIIEKHGGRIWVESIKGAGATFYFTLPKNTDEINSSIERSCSDHPRPLDC